MVLQISDDIEHARALAEIDKLWDAVPDTAAGAGTPDGRRLISLAEAVEEYERRRWPLDPEP